MGVGEGPLPSATWTGLGILTGRIKFKLSQKDKCEFSTIMMQRRMSRAEDKGIYKVMEGKKIE